MSVERKFLAFEGLEEQANITVDREVCRMFPNLFARALSLELLTPPTPSHRGGISEKTPASANSLGGVAPPLSPTPQADATYDDEVSAPTVLPVSIV
jgi:hypothetical protein